MDCPTCGRANAPETRTCDCGYDFGASKPAEFPGWQISLGWRQKLAAFWSIAWPAWMASYALAFVFTHGLSIDQLNRPAMALAGQAAFWGTQAVLTRRLVHKNYRSFRIYVFRDGGITNRTLSIREAVSVWLWILGPQLAIVLSLWAVSSFWGATLPRALTRAIPSMSLWLWLLAAGPYGIGLALRARYRGYRLQAHGLR